MTAQTTLFEAYKQTKYKHTGHGPRNVNVLKTVMDEIDGERLSDMYGNGRTINPFEEKMAEFLGKEAAVFFPSGTMAQQIALRIWADEKGTKKIGYHPLSHLEIHEENGIRELHGLEPVLLTDRNHVVELEDITKLEENPACILLELPQREIGGQLPSYQTLEQISAYCREQGIKLHLDGARLLEILPFYQKTAAEVSALFDSVYLSFYKGIGGIAGAILAGDKDLISQSKVWKRRHGGDLISLYPYTLSADYYFEQRKDQMALYYEQAKTLASFYNECPDILTVPREPVSNMFHVHVNAKRDVLEPILIDIYEETDLGLTGFLGDTADGTLYFEVNVGDAYANVPQITVEKAFQLLREKLQKMYVKGV
ncbi:beta-eliminating lyase-related protein [Halobacillus salinarum]|uniref:Beta-eliminating lyase-related protein n=1 Tax=Halobacillus salinarum TaxID=2932257 RepID=A0ABY4ELI9_9BACI|nr:beta-eliminating lyase-related protein [Halobacillus salinarum]UOQ44941.1 beta-eliminating lyase-related protein [Halobacillus salinarum]